VSNRRRIFLIASAALVVIAVLTVTLVSVLGGGSRRVSQGALGPVVLVPGYGGSLSALQPIRARLQAEGRTVQQLSLPDGGVGDLHLQATDLAHLVAGDIARGAPSVDLVGYSAGGVTVRLYVDQDGGLSHVRRVVTIGSPQHGTDVASAAGLLLGSGCTGGCAQLQTGSSLLDQLNAGHEIPAGIPWVTTWTTDDQTVVPADSAELAGADNIEIQRVCPSDHPTHSTEPRDPLVIGIVVQALGAGALPNASPAACDRLRALGSTA
jgi:triacylglycerol esterase/lipase EstA (alpha/beta hydrolase family)